MFLTCAGWPRDAATIRYLVVTLLELAQALRAALPPNEVSFTSSPEVAIYLSRRNDARMLALVVALALFGVSTLALTVLAVILLVR